jgi:hypothetical protein
MQIATIGTGALLLLCGVAAFVVFPQRRGFDLAVPIANLLLGALLVGFGQTAPATTGRWLALGALLAAAPIVLLRGVIATVHEIGEVVVLRTTDERGSVWETRMAVLDHRGSTWIGADRAGQRWVRRLATNPRVELVRGGVARCHVAVRVEDPETREEVFQGIERKYWIGRLVNALGRPIFARSADAPEKVSVAFRLDPCPDGSPTL